ncbi:MAG: serine dehydratase beta chain [Paracoccaceae bacterium]
MICAAGPKKSPAQGDWRALEPACTAAFAFSGKGLATDRAVVLDLLGFRPDTLDPDAAEVLKAAVRISGRIAPPGLGDLAFALDRDLVFDYSPPLPGHANGLILRAYDKRGNPYLTQTYYFVGGGFVLTAAELEASKSGDLHA